MRPTALLNDVMKLLRFSQEFNSASHSLSMGYVFSECSSFRMLLQIFFRRGVPYSCNPTSFQWSTLFVLFVVVVVVVVV